MYFSFFYKSLLKSFVLTIILLSTISLVVAQVRTSPSYTLESDSVNFGGGLSDSANYSLESTAGEVATGLSDSASYSLRAGYQQMQEVFLSLSAASDVTMTPSIGGITGGTGNGSTTVVVLTDSPSGYELSIRAESAPAMRNGAESIADYVPLANPNPDYFFATTTTEANFGFSPEGPDITSRFLNNGTACALGSTNTALRCWDGLDTVSKVIARGSSNQPSGVATKINFRVVVGGNIIVPEGDYVATTTLTALPL